MTNKKQNRHLNGRPNFLYLSSRGKLNDFPLNHPEYRISIIDFLKLAEKKFNVFYTRGREKHLGNGIFSDGYVFSKGKFIPYPKLIAAKVIFNKAPLHSDGGRNWKIINQWGLMKVMQDKYKTYRLFKKFMKPTYRIKNKKDFNQIVKKMKTKKVVFKPNEGSSGRGIIIAKKDKIKNRLTSFDGLLQEFIDTSNGIPGICQGRHDMRILIMNGKIIQTYVRQPKKRKLLANIAQGGKMLEIPKKTVPIKAISIAQEIDEYFKKFPFRIYAADFGFENSQPYLFELNSQPGFPYKKWTMYYKIWHRSLLNILFKAAQQ